MLCLSTHLFDLSLNSIHVHCHIKSNLCLPVTAVITSSSCRRIVIVLPPGLQSPVFTLTIFAIIGGIIVSLPASIFGAHVVQEFNLELFSKIRFPVLYKLHAQAVVGSNSIACPPFKAVAASVLSSVLWSCSDLVNCAITMGALDMVYNSTILILTMGASDMGASDMVYGKILNAVMLLAMPFPFSSQTHTVNNILLTLSKVRLAYS